MADTIQTLTDETIRERLRAALDDPDPVSAACDFVLGVDWSGLEAADAAVVRTLGELEQLTTDLSEGVVTRYAFLDDVRLIVATITIRGDMFPSRATTLGAIHRSIGSRPNTERIRLTVY